MTTEDYVNEIGKRREAGQPISVDFARLPDGVDTHAVAAALSKGLPKEYETEIQSRHTDRKSIKLDYGAINPKPSIPNVAVSAAKAAGQLIGHTARVGEKIGLDIGERGLDAAGRAAGQVTEKLGLPNVDSPGVVERVTKAAQAAEKQLHTPPSEQEREAHPIATSLHLTRPLRALGAFVDESLPEYSALKRWEDRSKLGSLKRKLDDVIAHGRKKDYADAQAMAPVEQGPQPMYKIAARVGIETASDLASAAGEFAASFTTPTGALENLVFAKGAGAVEKAALEGMVRVAPEAALKMKLPLGERPIKMHAVEAAKIFPGAWEDLAKNADAQGRVSINVNDWKMADTAVHQNVVRHMEKVRDVLGPEATPAALEAATKDLTKTSYEVLARKAWGLKQRGAMRPLAERPGPQRQALPAPGEASAARAGSPLDQGPKHQPIDPQHVAATVMAAGVEGVDAQVLAQKYPWVYSSASGLADVPPAAMAKYQAWSQDIAKALNLPAGTPVDVAAISFAVKTGKANYIALDALNKEILRASASQQGASPEILDRVEADALTAAERPAEALVAHHAEKQAVQAFNSAKQEAEWITANEARKAAAGKLPDGEVAPTEASGPQHTEGPAVSAEANAQIPGRTEGLQQAAEAGVGLPEAATAHREAALEAQEAGTLDPDIAHEYAEHGDDSFDPEALEAQAMPLPDLEVHPGLQSLEDFQKEWVGASPELHKTLKDELDDLQKQHDEKKLIEDIKETTQTPQPGLDFFRKEGHKIDPKAIARGGYGGEMENARQRGILAKGGYKSIDQAREALAEHFREMGISHPMESVNDLFELLDKEARLGTKAKAAKDQLNIRSGLRMSEKGGEFNPEGQGNLFDEKGNVSPESAAQPLSKEDKAGSPAGGGGPNQPAATSSKSLESSYDVSIDPKIKDVKARADDWLAKEAAARGMENNDTFKVQFGTYVHRRLNEIQKEYAQQYMKLPSAEKEKFEAEWDKNPLKLEADEVANKSAEFRQAYPDLDKKVPHRDPEAEKKILEGFKPIKEAAVTQKLNLKFMGKTYPVASLSEAQDMWDKVRDVAIDQGLGNSDLTEDPIITDSSGKALGWVSWNGRVWKGSPMDKTRVEWIDDKKLGENIPAFGSAPTFYSKLQKDIQARLPDKATVGQVEALLRDAKEDEVKWSGIREFLAGKDKISKPELLEFLRANQLEIKEVTKGEEGDSRTGQINVRTDQLHTSITRQGYRVEMVLGGMPGELSIFKQGGGRNAAPLSRGEIPKDIADKMEEYSNLLVERDERQYGPTGNDEARYMDYQLPGGKNYRELLFTIPIDASKGNGWQDYRDEASEKGLGNEFEDLRRHALGQTDVDMKSVNKIKSKMGQKWVDAFVKTMSGKNTVTESVFHSGHFVEPNILAHVRFNDRVDADGKKVLFVEELQSDWHQKGRREGYANKNTLSKDEQKILENLNHLNDFGRLETAEQNADFVYLSEKAGKTGVPDAPFKKTWHEFALKRMVRYAAENGYDKLAWTTGAQQADRYDLSKQVKNIQWEKNDDGTFNINAPKPDGNAGIYKEDLALEEVRDLVGKDIADKITAGEGREDKESSYRGWKIIEGDDLRIGGHGMQGFYDKMVPSFLNKFCKKWGSEAGKTKIQSGVHEEGDTKDPLIDTNRPGYKEVHALPITEGLRNAALKEGFSLFEKPPFYYGMTGAERRDFNAEAGKAYGSETEPMKVLPEIQKDLNFGSPNKLPAKLAKDGKIDYRGLEVNSIEDVAEIVASRRHPQLEHNNFVLTREGKVVSHMVFTSGLPNAVLVTDEDKAELMAEMKATGADMVWSGHNHPSGDHTQSAQDMMANRGLREFLGDKYQGMVVTDDKLFTHVDADNKVDVVPFLTEKEKFPVPEGPSIEHRGHLMAEASKSSMLGRSHVVLYLDAKHRVLGVEDYALDVDVPKRLKETIVRRKASAAAVVAPASAYRKNMIGMLPQEVLEAVFVDKNGFVSSIAGKGDFGESAYPEATSTRLAEDMPRFMGGQGMDASDLQRVLEEKKIAVNSPVTARVALEGVKRGTKGEIQAISLKGVRLLVKFGDKIMVTRPENLVETNVKPGARQALEDAEKATGAPTQSVKKIVESQQAGLTKEYVTQTVRQALSTRFRAEAFAARAAARKTKADLTAQFRRRFEDLKVEFTEDKEALKAKFQSQMASVEWAKGEITKYIKDTLPVEARGKYLDTVRTIKSPLDVNDVFFRVDEHASLLYKKGLIEDINKLAGRAVDSPSIAVEDKRLIRAFMAELAGGGRGMSQRTMEVEDHFAKGPGPGQGAAQYVWNQLKKLGRGAAKDLPEIWFEDAHDRLSVMLRTGWEKKWDRDTAATIERQLFLERLKASNPPRHEYGKRVRGKDLARPSLYDRQVTNRWLAISDWYQKNYLAIMPIDAMLDELGGAPGTYSNPLVGFKKEIDGHYWDLMNEEDRTIKTYDEMAKKLSVDSQKRIGTVLAREQKGGLQRLMARTDLSQQFIMGIKLTPEEAKVKDFMRSFMDAMYPRVSDVMAKMFNTEVRKVLNYFQWMTDVEALNDLRMEQRFEFDMEDVNKGPGAPRYPDRKFTKHRGAAGLPVEINADKVFRSYVHNSLHLVNLGPALKKYQDVFNSEEFGGIVGGETQSAMKDYLEVVARDGRGDPALRRAWLDRLRANVGAGLVPFHITPALLHASKWFNAPVLFGAKKALAAATEFTTNPDIREFLRVNVPEWRDRGGYDDPSLKELEFNQWLAKANRTGLIPLRYAEQWSAGCTLWAAYKEELAKKGIPLDLEKPDKEALLSATLLMRRAEGSPLAKDLPLAMSAGRGLFNNVSDNRAIGQFQMFPWTRFSYMTHDIPVRFKRDKIDGAFALVYMAAAYAAELGARSGGQWIQIGLLALLGFDTAEMVKKQEKRDAEFLPRYLEDIIRSVPLVGQAFEVMQYGQIPVASIAEPLDALHGVGMMANAKTERAAMAGFWKSFNAVSAMLGLGILTQFANIFSKVKTGGAKPKYTQRLEQLNALPVASLTSGERHEKALLAEASQEWEKARKELSDGFDRGDMVVMAAAAKMMQDNLETTNA